MPGTLNVTYDEVDSIADLPHGERRGYERSRLIIELSFDGGDATGVASTRDIGAGGLYMNTQAELPEGSRLTLRIPSGGGHVVVTASVIYSNPGRGVGVRFDGLSEMERDAIERISATPLP